MLYYGGESNVPGAPGNLFAGTPSFDINRRPGSLGGRSGEQLKRLYEGGTQQNEKLNEELRNRGIMPGAGPQLPLASNQPFGFPMGNAAGVANAQFFEGAQLAQAYPGGQPVGNVAGLGGAMQMNPGLMEQMQQQMLEAGGSKPPINFGVDIEDDKVKALRGQVNAQLDANQRFNLGGQYNIQDQSGRLGVGYQTPTFGFDVNLTRTPRMQGGPAGYGAMMNMGGRF